MNALPRELTSPWEQACRRCQVRTIGAFGVNGLTVNGFSLVVGSGLTAAHVVNVNYDVTD